ncbi:somatomedin-B and thrombospondin type-1 domain-containing protein-like isoform X2 [Athene cunicularia]|uniref:somatomedin-B and thrombospondin type-1 domain-containing protein-like isoform X2 n=1 Tax=Athene cunicularia TaxID=194338 RepID=UPI000EF6E65A|nr:somatomedin-B and thrombospondin type-1 domain-containing protein-like isoform X2 [Athene cunicularia]
MLKRKDHPYQIFPLSDDRILSITALLFPPRWIKSWEEEDIKLHGRSARRTEDRISQAFRNASLGSATVIPCVVSQWSVWSGCAEPCKTTYRVRRRHVIQEPRNGGEACPPLEERAGCVEYWTWQGTECKQSLIPALITTGGFGKARKKRATADGNERAGYCVEFQLVAIMPGCLHSHHSYTHWMQYLREGHTVCVECQHPALDSRSLHCYGDGSGSKNNQLLHWQAVGNPRCKGTWKRIRQLDTCSCPSVHSFLFI